MDYCVKVDCFTLPIAIHDTTHWPTEDLHPCISNNFCQKSHYYNNRYRNSIGHIIFLLHVKKNLDYSLLGCNALLFEVPTFQRTYSLHLEDRISYPEDEGDRFFQNVGTQTPKLHRTSCPIIHTHYY
jgi:hypothetical protein